MNRVTNLIAEQTANALLQQRSEILKKLKEERKELATAFYTENLPSKVVDLYRKHPAFFNTSSSIRFGGAGLDQRYYHLTRNLPKDSTIYTTMLTDDQAKCLVDIDNQIEAKQEQFNKLKCEISVALYNLRTFANVERDFPEAFKLLPKPNAPTALTVNISDIRKRIAI